MKICLHCFCGGFVGTWGAGRVGHLSRLIGCVCSGEVSQRGEVLREGRRWAPATSLVWKETGARVLWSWHRDPEEHLPTCSSPRHCKGLWLQPGLGWARKLQKLVKCLCTGPHCPRCVIRTRKENPSRMPLSILSHYE